MPIRLNLPPTFADRLAQAQEPLIGLLQCSSSAVVAEIMASSGIDWILLDTEHAPNGLESTLAQLYAMSAYPVTPVVRLPVGDRVLIKQFLDLGAQNLLVPMVESAEQATELVRAMRYEPRGVRGVGSALARSARWNRVENYLHSAEETISLTAQIESATGVANAEQIAGVDGVDVIFIGPSDLAASMGLIGQQDHPDVKQAVYKTIDVARSLGKPVGVNAFVKADALDYIERGANFVSVGADVSILARGTEALVDSFAAELSARVAPAGDGSAAGDAPAGDEPRASY